MNLSKNTMTLILMCTSIGLLILLQVLWLQKVYDDAYAGLQKESNFIFRTTIRGMMDSLMQQNIQPVEDSLKGHSRMIRRFSYSEALPGDTATKKSIEVSDARVQVFVQESVPDDSVSRALRPLIAQFRDRRESRNFIIRLSNDSLNSDDLQEKYCAALSESGIGLSAKIRRIDREEHEPWREMRNIQDSLSTGLSTEPFPATPFVAYVADLSEYNSKLLKGMLPQIGFSLFLTLLTTVSFVLMYRNIRSQQRLMELKNDFISNVSHELKTPVATVSVAIEALRNFDAMKDPKVTKEYLDIAQNELNRLSIMTDKILKTSVFEKNGVTFVPESVNLEEIVNQVVSSLKLLLDQRHASVTINKKGESFVVSGSTTHLTNVVYNLIDNAIKYSRDVPTINVSLEQKNGDAILSVSDNGIGIPAEYKEKIFEKFFRVPSGDVHNTKGYGLGLSYVQSVVKAHAGTISVDTSPDGTTFQIKLPL